MKPVPYIRDAFGIEKQNMFFFAPPCFFATILGKFMRSAKFFLFAFLLAVLAAGFAAAQPKAAPLASLANLPESDSFSSAEDRFAINLHRELADRRPVPTGSTVSVYVWTYGSLSVQVIADRSPYPFAPLRTDADYEKFLAAGKQMAFGALNPGDVIQTKISLGDYKGYELSLTLPEGSKLVGRAFVADKTIYEVIAVFSPGKLEAAGAAYHTLDSFRILSPAATTTAAATAKETKETAALDLKKANGRPGTAAGTAGTTGGAASATGAAGAKTERQPEPFDKADVKTMAAQCVSLDTESGAIEMEVYPESAPETVRNFLNLAATGAFDTTVFSRIVPGFVIQGGNLSTSQNITQRLAQQSARTIPDEPNALLHERGIVSMARPEEPNGASTHFFILLTPAPDLDRKFAAFGRVTKGMDIVEAINKMPVTGEKPDKPVRIKKAAVAPCAVNSN
jgi:peptidyl-prolyl cis-trans isomerase B (cyclophilin B)